MSKTHHTVSIAHHIDSLGFWEGEREWEIVMAGYWGPGWGWEASQAHVGAVGHEMGMKSFAPNASHVGFSLFRRGNPACEASHTKEFAPIRTARNRTHK